MEKYFRSKRFNANPNSPTASKEWKYLLRTLQNLLNSLNSNSNNTGNIDKLNLLVTSPILQHMMKLSANFISGQAMKYSFVINWQPKRKILEKLLTNLSKIYSLLGLI